MSSALNCFAAAAAGGGGGAGGVLELWCGVCAELFLRRFAWVLFSRK